VVADGAVAAPPRTALKLLADRTFGAFFAGRLATSIGIWLHGVVAAIAAFDATGSAIWVGVVSAVQFTPQIVLAPLAGAWADRGDVRNQMIIGRLLAFAGSVVLAFWCAWSGDLSGRADVGVVAATSFIVGLGLVVGGPAMQSAVPLLVRREELPAALALNTAPITVGRIAGPALGALSAAGLGYPYAFLIAAATHLLFIALLAPLRFPAPEGRVEGERYSIRDGLRFVRSDRSTLIILVGVTALGLCSEPTVTLAPPLAAELGGSIRTTGVLTASMGVGAAVGIVASTVLAHRLAQSRLAFAGILTMAAGLGICAAPLDTPVAIVGFALSGLGFSVSVTSLSTSLQMRLPAVLRGRVMALWLMGFVGSRPVGAMLAGVVADAATVRVAFGVVAVVLLGAAVVCRPSRVRAEMPSAPAPRAADED
jgi:MFS family permease